MIENTLEKITSQWMHYLRLMRLDKPIGILLLLWPTLMALWIAGEGKPDLFVVMIFILGTIVMRSLGCVVNDLLDKKFDQAVSRTKERPLVTEAVSKQEAFGLILGLWILAFLLVIQLNLFTILVSICALILSMIYPLMKRYTHLPQAVLGITFSFGILMAFTALSAISLPAFLLFFANVFWVVAYDTVYAMVDRADDIKIGVKSTAILFGKADRMMVFSLQIIALMLLIMVGKELQAGIAFYLGITGASLLVVYQQYLIKDRLPERCFKAFLNNHFFGAILFFGLCIDYGLRPLS